MLISLMHPPVQKRLGLKVGDMCDMEVELTKLQSAACGGHAVAGERGVAGKDALTVGNLSFGTGPDVTSGPGPDGGVGAGAGAESAGPGTVDNDVSTTLMRAADKGHTAVVEALAGRCADVNAAVPTTMEAPS